MKVKILIFSIIFFLFTIEASAQPGCHESFSPFNVCQSNFEWYDHFFYGEVVSFEGLKDISVNSTYTPWMVIVEVKKSFKGEVARKVKLYLSANLICAIPKKGEKYLFYAVGSELDGEKVYFSEKLSRPMTDYSKKAIKEVFADIRSILRNEKRDYVEGGIYNFYAERKEKVLKSEDFDRQQLFVSYTEPIANVLIEAINETDGKIYRTQSKADGTYRIDRIPNGRYQVKLHLPPDKERQTSQIYEANDNKCSRRWMFSVVSKASK